jgi:hypothetical protein
LAQEATPVAEEEASTGQYNYNVYLPVITGATGQPQETEAGLPEEEIASEAETFTIEEVSASAISAISAVDATEDDKALGYPDSRKIVRDSTGGLYVAYRKKFNNLYRIYVSKSTDNGATWSVLNNNQPVETVGNYTQRVPSLAIDNQDRLHMVWYGNDATNLGNEREIKYIRSAAFGASWETWRNLGDAPGYANQDLWQEHPTLYVNGSNVYVVWEGKDATYPKESLIKFIRSTDYGTTWLSSIINVSPTAGIKFSRPTLVVSYVGETRYLYSFAYGEKAGVAQIYWSRSTDNGNTWSTWQKVSASSADQRHVTLARDNQNRLHLVWRQITDTGNRTILRYRVYDPALNNGQGAWATSTATIASITGYCLFSPSITVTSNNKIWVAWSQSSNCSTMAGDDPKDGQIVYISKVTGGNWTTPSSLTTTGKHVYVSFRRVNTPTAAVGSVDLVWVDISTSVYAVRQANLGPW